MTDLATFERSMVRLAAAAVALEETPLFVAEACADEMRDTVAVLTGHTQSTIEVVASGAAEFTLSAAGATIYLEFGTVNMAPETFYRPAIDGAPEKLDALVPAMRASLYRAVR